MIIPSESYESIFTRYSSSIKWMESIGVNIGRGRTTYYGEIISYWKDNYKTASADEAKKIFPDFVSTMFDLYDFVAVYEAFKDTSFEDLDLIATKLQKAVSGPIKSADETPRSTAARNFLFEAIVAARGHRPNLGIEAILNAKSDTGLSFDNRKIWIECKRVTRINKIERNVRKAISQLEKILNQRVGAGHRGLVALDVSKILQDGSQILVRKNDSELSNTIGHIAELFVKDYSPIWQKVFENKNQKIIGVIFRTSYMATSEERNLLVHVSDFGMNPRLGIRQADHELQKNIALLLRGQI